MATVRMARTPLWRGIRAPAALTSSARRRYFLDPPWAAVLGQQLEERDRVEGLGAEHPGAGPGAAGEQLEGDDGVDRGLPDHALVSVLAHRPLVVDDVVEVGRPVLAVLA